VTGGEEVTELVERLLEGDRRAAAKAISLVENNDPQKQALLSRIYPHTGKAHIIGITGTPGSGKSTLADRLIDFYRKQGKRVGVIAVDPTSPFTGGAILGDRIRMQAHALDKGVFIRSMGTRGSLGGLSRSTREAVTVLDAMGREVILVETVGLGQSEVDIVKTADTTLVVLTPAGGDSVQTLKAGIMEIADIFVVNKADLDGADRTIREVQMMLDLNNSPAAWRPPVTPTKTLLKEGLEELLQEIERHRQHLSEGGRLEESRKEKARLEILELVEYKIKSKVWKQVRERDLFADMLQRILAKTLDPYTAADQLLQEIEI
jgi:LAO/AO transport system kinase